MQAAGFSSYFCLIWCSVLLSTFSASAGELNLQLDQDGVDQTAPRNWSFRGSGYNGCLDDHVVHSGKHSYGISRNTSDTGNRQSFGAASCLLPAGDISGKTITFSAFIKTQGVESGWAGLWFRADGEASVLALNNGNEKGIKGNTEWVPFSIEVNVPADAIDCTMGMLLVGNGAAWFDDLELKIDGKVYETSSTRKQLSIEETLERVRKTLIPLATTDSGADYSDLLPLKPLIADARIVALGEATHGTREFFTTKHRMIEFLVEKMGFTHVAVEGNAPELHELNRFIQSGEGDPKALVESLEYWTLATQEFLDLILWMRSYNAAGNGRVQISGLDINQAAEAMATVTNFVKAKDPAFMESLGAAYSRLANRHTDQCERGEKCDAGKTASQILEHLERMRSTYLKNASKEEIRWVIQNARVVYQSASFCSSSPHLRDRFMAENVSWTLENAAPGTKLILWAHNGHVSKRQGCMGNLLAAKYGGAYRVFGFSFHEGSYNAMGKSGLTSYTAPPAPPASISWFLCQSGAKSFILDLRSIAPAPEGRTWLSDMHEFRVVGGAVPDGGFQPAAVTEDFDFLVFLDATTPSRLLWK